MTRWGAYTSRNMLSDYAAVLDKLIAAMQVASLKALFR